MATRRGDTSGTDPGASNGQATSTARRLRTLYQVRELCAFAPSDREAILVEALNDADRGGPMVRQAGFGILCAILVMLLLAPLQASSATLALSGAASFCACFLLTRRACVRRHLRTRVTRRRTVQA